MLATATRMNAPRGCEIRSTNIQLFLTHAKEYTMQATTGNVKVIGHNDGKAIKAAIKPAQELLSPTAIAQKLDLSPSYVYASIGRLGLTPVYHQGKTGLFSADVLDKFPVRQRARRTARVARTVAPEIIVAPKALEQPAEGHTGSLMERISTLEQVNKALQEQQESLMKRLEQVAAFVGA